MSQVLSNIVSFFCHFFTFHISYQVYIGLLFCIFLLHLFPLVWTAGSRREIRGLRALITQNEGNFSTIRVCSKFMSTIQPCLIFGCLILLCYYASFITSMHVEEYPPNQWVSAVLFFLFACVPLVASFYTSDRLNTEIIMLIEYYAPLTNLKPVGSVDMYGHRKLLRIKLADGSTVELCVKEEYIRR